MNVLVTGATGFIGRALCTKMLAEGWHVRGTVRSLKGAFLPSGVEAMQLLEIGPDVDWSSVLAGIDTVVHLIARVHTADSGSEDSLQAHRLVNCSGTERLARQAAQYSVRRLVFLSTVKVHGEENSLPYDEDAPCMPRDPYGVSKMEAEEVLRTIGRDTGLEVVILRAPLVYGANVKANFLKLMDLVRKGVPLPLASVANKRSLIYVGNLVDALTTCTIHPAAAGQTYLVSDGEDVSTPDLIRRTAKALERPARLFPVPVSCMRLAGKLSGKSGVVNRLTGSLTVDSTKIRRELGWKPPFTLDEGLAETARWFKRQ